ncbi:MAG: hypothetical protein A2073_01145 [Deltaproteobacteria bacterium GWC2_42_11]|nr:MAG: hypothetical protein A2073_01145 [Deltaproteobacteria bacterium GWC2_42_11]HBO84793.1 hypothetical protein [Deltaproteobacteria bacterium]
MLIGSSRILKKELIFIFLILTLLIISCEKKRQDAEVIATVNDAHILLKDFQKDVSAYSRHNPSFKITPDALEEYLKSMIDKKLMIQKAVEMGLSEDERFVETIKTFWEQTLIRELIDAKTKEWADRLFAAEDEIKKEYERMQYAPTIKIVRVKEKDKALIAAEKMKKGEMVDNEMVIGPLLSEDVKTDALYNVFEMDTGDSGVFQDKEGYIAIYVVKKDKVLTAPLKDIYSQIKSNIINRKRQKKMEEWLDEARKSSKIQINTQLLNRIANE